MKTSFIAGASVLALTLGSASLALAQAPKMEGQPAPGAAQGAPKEGAAKSAEPHAKGGSAMTPGKSAAEPRSGAGNSAASKGDNGKKSAEHGATPNKSAERSTPPGRDHGKAAEQERKPPTDHQTKSAQSGAKRDMNKESSQERSKAADTRERSINRGTAQGSSNVTTGSVPREGRVELSGEKRTQVLGVFAKHRSEAREQVDVRADVGGTVPTSVRLFVIPEEIVELVPEYRRYRYFILGDVVLIVDPDRHVIIDVLPIAA